ncbi:ER membrane protein complex subunit 1 isoform X2 [Lycorma delicatula]|uniref:ER membrane protein complex subunit 1 isoform X2 n=1 Tax=Lycorma delicatula TaxID=130591 RepID=UPI003F517648
MFNFYLKWLIFIILVGFSLAIYEDQIGKFDWRQKYIGKIKFSSIDSKSAVKKVFVATEENVIAALFLKSGDIAWRHVLERGSSGQLQLMQVDTDVITVSGNGPFIVRGWNPSSGYLHYEWLILSEKSQKQTETLWTYHQGKLYQVSLKEVTAGKAEVTTYNVRSGTQLFNYSFRIPDVKNKVCRLVGLTLVCLLDEGKLRGVSVIASDDSKVLKLDAPHPAFNNENSKVSQELSCSLDSIESTVDFPAVAVVCGNIKSVVTVVQNEFVQDSEQLSLFSGVAIVPYSGGSHIKLVTSHSDGVIKLSGTVIETGESVPEVDSNFHQMFSLSDVDISSTLCTLRRDRTISCQLLLSGVDYSIIFIQTPSKIVWTREEALTSIVAVELIDLPVSDVDAAIEKEFDNKEGGFVGMFFRRIMSQILQVRSLLLTILSLGESTPSKGLLADLVRDQFGLHKMIVAVTSVGKLFGIDNLSGEIVWQKYLKDIKPFHSLGKPLIPLYIQRTARHLPHPAQCFLLFKHQKTEESVIYTFNPINGQPLGEGLVPLGYQVIQTSLLHATDEEFLKAVLLLDSNGKIHVYPKHIDSVVLQHAKSTFLFTANSDTGLIKGYTLAYSYKQNLVAKVVWQIKFAHKITGIISKCPLEKVHSQGRVLGDRSVLYKYINPNLVAVITQAEDPLHKNVLSIHLIDIVSGSIIFSVAHKRATEPVHLVHSENWVVYSYFSDKSRRTEIATLELYEGKTQSNTTAFSSLANVIFPIVERQSYILPSGIDAMKETITEKGITSKHILVALNSGGILEIPWIFLDPRRPLGDIREEGVIPYIPELPIPAEAIINYNQTLSRVKSIHTAPSGLESTCLVFVYGLDLFYTRVAPSKTFDVLKEDFDHMLISAVLVGLSVAAYATKRLASRKALKQAWK